ncbi:RidA family protein [Chitinasiproducens palmae]|uniref:Enamine deaminase RidA, house cleaning of reactive enamine intermediates, YjgF/YER057c/UK114 family n=1 Tax=Chitinasiproducens palmae TaxID=1770053 RepID=A0A1H2PLE8_9BURK|nr:RidA family protein [Chitinasiproducens palmae]SDV46846.1 Enamine deaminase RidA, house cleaning of reactive enamine intermediates, YjgF/YER057c/UK114 family [Chitinasiproducens palmae]
MSATIQRFQTNSRMSQVVIANGFAFLSGQVPDTAGASITQQTQEVLGKIDALLKAHGIGHDRLVSANVWLGDASQFGEFNAVWDAWVPEGQAPTRACVQSPLMKPGCDVEVAIVALV